MPAVIDETDTRSAADQLDELWSDAERKAWRPPERIDSPRWAEKYRYLTRRQTSRPGPWRNDVAPHLIGVMQIADRPGVEVLTILKASQVGVSEAVRNVIGRRAHLQPDPALLVLPDKDMGEGIIRHRIIPLFEDTQVLAELSTGRRWDKTNQEIVLVNGFTLRLGYSGSIASVAAHPARYVICDERSKFQDDGKVSIADSIDARTSTFENSVVIHLSTPGADPDPTAELFESSQVKLFYYVPCPHCGRHQTLAFDRLKWAPGKDDEPDKVKRAAAIVANRAAWVECENPRCATDHPAGQGRVTDDHKRAIVTAGYWGTADGGWKLFNDGREEGTLPPGTRFGMHVPAMISLAAKHRFIRIAERFVMAEGDTVKLRGFYNEVLGEVFKQTLIATRSSSFSDLCRPNPETGFVPPRAKVVPRWVSRLLMTVDTQKDHFYFVIRGWGQRLREQRIHHGRVTSFRELEELFYGAMFPYDGEAFPPVRCHKLGIDSGGGKMGLDSSRTDEVYRWCLRNPAALIPLKGESEPRDQVIRLRNVTYTPPDKRRDAYSVWLHLIDSQHFNDVLQSKLEERVSVVDHVTGEVTGDVPAFSLNDVDDDDYNRHMANMHKVVVKSRGKKVARWQKKTEGARVDYRMCEVYQQAMAHGPGKCFALPSPEQVALEAREMARQLGGGGIRTPDGRAFLANRR